MGVLDWLLKRSSTEEAAPGLSLPARKAGLAWRPAGPLPEQLDAFLKAYEPRSLPPELSGGAPRKDVWGANALKNAALHRALTHGHASPCLVTTATIGGEGICVYRDGEGQPRSFPVEVPSQVRSFPLRLNAVELEGRQGVYEWLLWFPPLGDFPLAVAAVEVRQWMDAGRPVHFIDVRRRWVIERMPIPEVLEHPIESWEAEDEKRSLIARLTQLPGFEALVLVDEQPARSKPRVPPVEELRGRLASAGYQTLLVSALDGGYPEYVHAIAQQQLTCSCQRCRLEDDARQAERMERRANSAGRVDYLVPRPPPSPEEMIQRVQSIPPGQLPPELRALPPGSVSRAVVVHKQHKEDNEGIDYYATYAWLDSAGQLRSETAHHGWEGLFGQSSYIAHLREGDVLHVVRGGGAESLHEQELITRMDKTPFRGKW